MRTNYTIIPYGNGRSYGDSALNSNILKVKPHHSFLAFDEKYKILHCEAGVLLSEIIETFVPRGWFLSIDFFQNSSIAYLKTTVIVNQSAY